MDDPWLILGDSNTLLNTFDKEGGGRVGTFNNTTFIRLDFEGNLFTWDKRRVGKPISLRKVACSDI